MSVRDGPFDALITFLYTRDLPRSAAFYEGMLGLPLVLDQGGCRIYATGSGGYLGICERADAAPSAGVLVTLVCDDVDGWHAALSGRGVVFETEPRPNPAYRIYHCFLRDPDGHRLEIQHFDDAHWFHG